MKTITLTLLLSVFTLGIFSQTGNLGDKPDECKKYLSLYGDYLKQEMFVDSYKFWVEAVKVCPQYNANLYDNGIYLMKKLQKGATKERKSALKDSIIWAYEQSIKFFGDNPSINEDFGADLIKSGKVERGVELVKKAIASSNNKVRASTIYYYSNALAVLKNKEKKDCEVLVKEYERLSLIIEVNSGKNGYDKAQGAVDKYLGPCLSCDNLLPIIRKKFELAKTDANERKKILSTLDRRECTNNDIYEALLIIETEGNPSADGFVKLAGMFFAKGQDSKAIGYLDKAIGMTDDASRKEKLLIDVAKRLNKAGNRSKAKVYVQKVLELNSNNGEAYLIKADMIGRSKCGTSAFDDAAINWAAYDMAVKAKNVDPSVSSKASKAMSSYKARFPTKQQVFGQGLKTGESYKTCNGYSTTVK